MQLSIEEFLFQNGSRHNELVKEVLANPLSSDFGLRTPEDMDSFIQDHLPSFKLVRVSDCYVAFPKRPVLVETFLSDPRLSLGRAFPDRKGLLGSFAR